MGTWSFVDDDKQPIPLPAIVCSYTLALYLFFNIAIYIKKKSIDQPAPAPGNHYNNGHVKDLFDVVATFLTTLILGVCVMTYTKLSRYTNISNSKVVCRMSFLFLG